MFAGIESLLKGCRIYHGFERGTYLAPALRNMVVFEILVIYASYPAEYGPAPGVDCQGSRVEETRIVHQAVHRACLRFAFPLPIREHHGFHLAEGVHYGLVSVTGTGHFDVGCGIFDVTRYKPGVVPGSLIPVRLLKFGLQAFHMLAHGGFRSLL